MAAEIDRKVLRERVIHLCELILRRGDCHVNHGGRWFDHSEFRAEAIVMGANEPVFLFLVQKKPLGKSGLGRTILDTSKETHDGAFFHAKGAIKLIPTLERLAILDLLAES